jgi:hypothetical protein
MDEDQFDSMSLRPFGSEDVIRFEADARRCTMLGVALWGRTSDDLQRQLNAPYPEIPSGFGLADLRMLQRWVQRTSMALDNPRNTWVSRLLAPLSADIFVGTRRFTAWEARGEVVRRAIARLESAGN